MLLEILTGVRKGETVELSPGVPGTIGREGDGALALPDRKTSRHHCRLEWTGSTWSVRDLESANGTWVDGERVREAVLSAGTIIKVGGTVIEVVAAEGSEPVDAVGCAPGSRWPSRAAGAALLVVGFVVAALVFWPERSSEPEASDPADAGPGESVAAPATGGPGAGGSGGAEPSGRRPDGGADPDGDPDPDGGSDPEGDGGSLRSFLADEVAPLTEARDWKRAIHLVRERSREERDDQDEALAELERLRSAARAELDAVRTEGERLVDAGDFSTASDRYRDLIARLPEALQSEALEGLDALSDRERKRRDRVEYIQAELVDASRTSREAIGRLRFRAARDVLRELAKEPVSDATLTRRRHLLVAEYRQSLAAWRHLEAVLEARASGKTPIDGRWAGGHALVLLDRKTGAVSAVRGTVDRDPARATVVRCVRGRLWLSPAGGDEGDGGGDDGGDIVCDVFALSDRDLASILDEPRPGTGDGEGSSPGTGASAEERRRGLATLLLWREGPERAAAFWRAAGLAGSLPGPSDGGPGTGGDGGGAGSGDGESGGSGDPGGSSGDEAGLERAMSWLRGRLRGVMSRHRELLGTESRDRAAWTEVLTELATLVALDRGQAERLGRRGDLEEAYRTARYRLVDITLSADVFHAESLERDGDSVRLGYDFRSSAQLAAFVPVHPETRVELAGGSLVLRGEVRFLEGQPFVGSLAVRLRVPSGGYSKDAPNINVALWTSGPFRVSPTGPLTLSLEMMKTERWEAGYALFGAGYRTVVSNWGGTPLEELRIADQGEPVKLPAHAVLVGRNGQPLNRAPGECVWVARPASSLRGALRVEVDWKPDECRWRINRRTVLPGNLRDPERIIGPGERRGSFNLLSLQSQLRISSVEVEGRLDAEWLGTRAAALAAREIQALAR